jgi:hypothetical protein
MLSVVMLSVVALRELATSAFAKALLTKLGDFLGPVLQNF